MRIAFANQKGGTGKTANAVGLAAAAGVDGDRVLLIDTDLGQDSSGTARPWHDGLFAAALRTIAPTRDDVTAVDFYGADGEKAKLAGGALRRVGFECLTIDEMDALGFVDVRPWRHVIVDCPPGQPAQIAEAFKIVDVAIIPVTSNHQELSGIGAIKGILESIERPVALHVLLNRIDIRQKAPRQVQDVLDDEDVEAFRTRIPRRASIEHLWPTRHPSSSLQGWVAWRDLWRELQEDDQDDDYADDNATVEREA